MKKLIFTTIAASALVLAPTAALLGVSAVTYSLTRRKKI